MLATGTDAVAGRQERLLYADDALNMPIQAATHWDSLGHIFYHDKMYNGHHASAVDSNGLSQLGIEHARDKLVGRGVLLDIARFKGVDTLKDGEGISNDDLDACAQAQKVDIRKGDFVSCGPARWKPATSAASGAAMPAAMRRASSSRAATGCTRSKWPACAPTPGAWRCGPTRPRTSTSPGTGW